MTEPTVPHCYRHPDREAGRSCTRCGKPACSECLVQAQVGSHCLDCAKASRPDVRTQVKFATSRVLTPVTYAIIGINLAVFLWTVSGGGEAILFGGNAHTDQLGVNKYLLQGVLVDQNGPIASPHEWYRLVSSGFVHFGMLHLAMNMYSLFILGSLLERKLGGIRFGLLYVASLLGGSAGILLLQPSSRGIHGGASGAIFGLMAALVISLWRQGVNPFQTSLGQVFLMNVMFTFFASSFISVGGHVGGAIAGGLCGAIMLSKPWKPAPKWATYVAPAAVMVVSVVASIRP